MVHPNLVEGNHDILALLGSGMTSNVYVARSQLTGVFSAIKLIREEFLQSSPIALTQVEDEITILKALKPHPNIVKFLSFGDRAELYKPSGRKIDNKVFLQLE